MSKKIKTALDGVAKTLLIPLYIRAVETQRPNSMIKDDRAVAIINQLDCDFSPYKFQRYYEIGMIMRVREFDRLARQFLDHNPDGVVVQIGCGLDTRFERVDNGKVEWFDLDLPEVITLRQQLIGGETGRYHLVSESILNDTWLDRVGKYSQRPFLFIAEGVLLYFEEIQVKSLVQKIREHFPIAELVSEIFTPIGIWSMNLQLPGAGIKTPTYWGLKHGKDMEKWGAGIVLLEEYYPFDDPGPRLGLYRLMRLFPVFSRIAGIFHYQLGLKPNP